MRCWRASYRLPTGGAAERVLRDVATSWLLGQRGGQRIHIDRSGATANPHPFVTREAGRRVARRALRSVVDSDRRVQLAGQSLDARREVHDVADGGVHEAVAGPDVADEGSAAGDSDADRDGRLALGGAEGEAAHRGDDLAGRLHG